MRPHLFAKMDGIGQVEGINLGKPAVDPLNIVHPANKNLIVPLSNFEIRENDLLKVLPRH